MQRPPWLQQPTVVDAVAGLIALTALAGVLWSPKLTSAGARATGSIEPVQISVDVRNLSVADPEGFLQSIRDDGRLSVVIRNQPAGSVSQQWLSQQNGCTAPTGSQCYRLGYCVTGFPSQPDCHVNPSVRQSGYFSAVIQRFHCDIRRILPHA